MAEKKTSANQDRTKNPANKSMLEKASCEGISTMFDRAAAMKPCPIGSSGSCCKMCAMGPCRLVSKGGEEKCGVCGATIHTVVARNFARAVAAGASAHSDHGRGLALSLLAVARGEMSGYQITDEKKLHLMAEYLGVETADKTKEKIAEEVAEIALSNFGRQEGAIDYVSRATEPRQKIWSKCEVTPRGVDREVIELLHRTHAGTDQDPEEILDAAVKAGLSDGWGGSMLATDISDILFGTPAALATKVNLGVLADDEVNIVVHGHEPTLSSMIVAVSTDPEIVEYAKSKGAKGVNITGLCCTSNETLMRQGIKSAGNFLSQELAIVTGAVEAMVVDIQCVAQGLARVANQYHTKLITTSEKAHIQGAQHMHFDEHRGVEIAKDIVKVAIDNYANRKEVNIPQEQEDMVAGFSHEYIRYMLGGRFRESFRPLNDNIINGRIQGLAGIVGCNNARVVQDEGMTFLVENLIRNNVLVVVTGCCATGSAQYGFLKPEAALEMAGDGLREVCETVGIPPVLHLGSCVDNSRILTVLTEVVKEGGLGNDISDLPAVGIAPEWMSEKALSIATYCAASGAYVMLGVTSPVAASTEVVRLMTEGWEEKYGGKLEFEPDYHKILEKSLDAIQKKRQALNIDVKQERVLYDMEMRRSLEV